MSQPAPQPNSTDDATELDKLADLAGKLLKVPKSEVDELRKQRKEAAD